MPSLHATPLLTVSFTTINVLSASQLDLIFALFWQYVPGRLTKVRLTPKCRTTVCFESAKLDPSFSFEPPSANLNPTPTLRPWQLRPNTRWLLITSLMIPPIECTRGSRHLENTAITYEMSSIEAAPPPQRA